MIRDGDSVNKVMNVLMYSSMLGENDDDGNDYRFDYN